MAGPSTAAGSADQISSLQEELICPICLELFDNPIQLPCLHSFCFKCIEAKTARDGRLHAQIINTGNLLLCTCPTCRKSFMIPNVGILPKNFSLASIVDKFKRMTGLKKVLCTIHNQDVGLFCEDCLALMCFSCYGDHKGHKIDDIKNIAARYKSKMELTLLPGLYMKQRQLEEATKHWNDIVLTEKVGKVNRNKHILREISTMKAMLQVNLGERLHGMAIYNNRLTNQLIAQCESKKKTVETELKKIKNLVTDIISDSDPAKTLQTYAEISSSGDHHIDKLADCAVNLPKKAIKMTLDPTWRKKLEEFSNSVKLKLTGVDEEGPEVVPESINSGDIFSLNNLPYNMKKTELEEQMTILIPLKDVTSLDTIFDDGEVNVHFSTSNADFLKLHQDTNSETVFGWKLNLRHEIKPAKSKSKVTGEGIEIILMKARKEKWDVIEMKENPRNDTDTDTTESQLQAESMEAITSINVEPNVITRSTSKRRSTDEGEPKAICTISSEAKKRKCVQPTNEELSSFIKEIVEKDEIENYIISKISQTFPNFYQSCYQQLIKDTIYKFVRKVDGNN